MTLAMSLIFATAMKGLRIPITLDRKYIDSSGDHNSAMLKTHGGSVIKACTVG